MADKQAATMAKWFHLNETCQFGMPAYVWADGGGEFCRVFACYLEHLGLRLVLTLPNNPHANGMVERINGLIVNGLR